MTPQANPPAPNLEIDKWVQGTPSDITQEKGNVILIFVFQINCPGCFLYGIPEAIELYESFQERPFKVWGLATAFEGDIDGPVCKLIQRHILNFDNLPESRLMLMIFRKPLTLY